MFKNIKEEWKPKKSLLDHLPAEDFTTCCFQKEKSVHPLWIAYRAILALYFVLTTIGVVIPWSREFDEDYWKFLIFVGIWTYLLETITFIIGVALCGWRYKVEKEQYFSERLPMKKTPWQHKLFWAFYNMTVSSTIVVTVIFWIADFRPEAHVANAHHIILFGANSFFMIVDLILITFPIRFLHFYWPLVYGITYLLFNVIYHCSGGEGLDEAVSIYEFINWEEEPGAAVGYTMLMLIFVAAVHFLFSFFNYIKNHLRKKTDNENDS